MPSGPIIKIIIFQLFNGMAKLLVGIFLLYRLIKYLKCLNYVLSILYIILYDLSMSGPDIKTIDGKYDIKSTIGGGGFSEVYLVEGPKGECALKLLKGESEGLKVSALEEFKHEFSILRNMRHPNIAGILDFGFDEKLGRYYYTSEFIEGESIVEATKDMDADEVTDLIVQTLRALEYIHSYRIYHFDIKAANILVTTEGVGHASCVMRHARLIDFGLSGIDPRGKMIGTPSYMPPEIVMRESADGRADLYSLGVLWYTILTRKNPFRSQNREETLSRQLKLLPPPPSEENEEIPEWMDEIILGLLKKNPAERYQTAESVIHDVNTRGNKEYPLETRDTLLSYIPDTGRFVGRVKDTALIEETVFRLKNSPGKAEIISVEGGIGTGKSRLLREMKYRLQLNEIRVNFASAKETGEFLKWGQKLKSYLTNGSGFEIFMLDDVSEFLADDAAAEEITAIISYSKRPGSKCSALIIFAMRSEDSNNVSSIADSITNKIRLNNFSEVELREYLASLTGIPNPPGALLNGVMRRTDGNPQFVTEVIKSLVSQGGLFDEYGRWKESLFEDVGVDFSKIIVTHTLNDLLVEKFQARAPDEQMILEALAVSGRPATPTQLGNFAGILEPYQITTGLVQKGIIERLDNFEVQFQNALMGEAIYANLKSDRKVLLHDNIARLLEEKGAPREEILRHRARGGDKSVALESTVALADILLARGHGREAIKYYNQAKNLLQHGDFERIIKLDIKIGEAYLIAHDYISARKSLIGIWELISESTPNPESSSWIVDTLIRLGSTYIKLQELGLARRAFDEAGTAISTLGGDLKKELIRDNFIAEISLQEGALDAAKQIFEATRKRGMELAPRERMDITNNNLGAALLRMGEFEKAVEIFNEDLNLAKAHQDDILIAIAYYNLAQSSSMQQKYSEAGDLYEKCAEVCKRSQNAELLMRTYNGLGNCSKLMGNFDKSIEYYERGIELHDRVHDQRGGAAIAINIGIIETSRGNLDAALNRLIPAVSYLKNIQQKTAADWCSLARGLLEVGDIYNRRREWGEAKRCLKNARDITDMIPQARRQKFWVVATEAEVARDENNGKELSFYVNELKELASGEAEKKKLSELENNIPEGKMAADDPVRESPASDYSKILEINKLIVAEKDIHYVLKTVVYYAVELAKAEAGAVLLINERGEFEIVCAQNLRGDDAEIGLSRTLALRAVEDGRAISTDDAMKDERFEDEASVCGHSLKSVLCLPIMVRRRSIGALYLDHRYKSGAFADVDMKILEAFADQAGLAIETSKAISASAEQVSELKKELSEVSQRIEDYKSLVENLKGEPQLAFGTILATSQKMKNVLAIVAKVADTDISILICGESGTGKELIARALHLGHPRRMNGKFVAINCGAIPATLIESELFGYKKGAFTGADRDKKGLIEDAHGGTLFLDEIAELNIELQVKLLRALEERECTRVGDTKPYSVDIRIISASNRDVAALAKENKFREDLYYRICQMEINLPPLRERPEDITALVRYFIKKGAPNREMNIHPNVMRQILLYDWPGNVRELENLVEVAVALTAGNVIDMDSIPANHAIFRETKKIKEENDKKDKSEEREIKSSKKKLKIDETNEYDPSKSWRDYERLIIAKCFEANNFNARDAAKELDISAASMYNKIDEWQLRDKKNFVYAESFAYMRQRKLGDYIPLIFRAALAAAQGKPSQAIANLRISQGYFYKMIKK